MNPLWQALWGQDIKATRYDAEFLQQQSQLQEQKAFTGTDYLGRTNPIQLLGNSAVQWAGTQGNNYTRDGYSTHGIAYSIITYITSTSKQIPWSVWKLDAQGNKKKVLENHPLTNLLWRPNPKQSIGELVEMLELLLLTTGNAYLWANRVSGSRAGELWVLPQHTEVLGGGWMQEVEGYRVARADGTYDMYEAQDVLHLKYANPEDSKYGLSPIAAGYKLITAANSGLDVRVKQYQNNGPQGILYHDDKDSQPLDAKAAQSVKNKLRSFFSPRRQQFDIPFTDVKLGYLQLGLSPVDLKVLEACDTDKNGIADLYRFPAHLLNGANGSTFNNVNEASKSLYTKCVIPLKRQVQEGLNRFLTGAYDDKVFIDIDTTQIAELQEDKKALAETLALCPWIKLKDKQAMMGVEVDPELDYYLYPVNMRRHDQPLAPMQVTPVAEDSQAA